MEDFDIAPNKIGESAQRVVDRAMEEARRRDHALLTNEHIFLAFAQVEWDTFAQVMRDLELNPHEILQALEEQLHVVPASAGRELRVAPATKLVFKLAFHQASRGGRQSIESSDIVFCDLRGESGRRGVHHPAARHRARSPRDARCHADARQRAARGAASQAIRAAAVPQAFRDESQPLRASGPAAAGLRPRPRNPAGTWRSCVTANARTP